MQHRLKSLIYLNHARTQQKGTHIPFSSAHSRHLVRACAQGAAGSGAAHDALRGVLRCAEACALSELRDCIGGYAARIAESVTLIDGGAGEGGGGAEASDVWAEFKALCLGGNDPQRRAAVHWLHQMLSAAFVDCQVRASSCLCGPAWACVPGCVRARVRA